MCARCVLLWQIQELKSTLEELGCEFGCHFDVDITDDLKIVWKAYNDRSSNCAPKPILTNGEIGYGITEFEADVQKMPSSLKAVLSTIA